MIWDLSATLIGAVTRDECSSEAGKVRDWWAGRFRKDFDGTTGLLVAVFRVCLEGLEEMVDLAKMLSGVMMVVVVSNTSRFLSLGAVMK